MFRRSLSPITVRALPMVTPNKKPPASVMIVVPGRDRTVIAAAVYLLASTHV